MGPHLTRFIGPHAKLATLAEQESLLVGGELLSDVVVDGGEVGMRHWFKIYNWQQMNIFRNQFSNNSRKSIRAECSSVNGTE